jgi:prophage regulatory protein
MGFLADRTKVQPGFRPLFNGLLILICKQQSEGVPKMANMILRLPAVKTRTGLSRSTIYLRVAEGRFPKPISLGARAVGWVDAEVEAWLAGQIELSRRTQGGRLLAPGSR